MTQYSSAIPTMLAFGDALEAADWPSPRPVIAVGATREAGYDLVLIGSSATVDQEFAGMRVPPHGRTESYALDVFVAAFAPGQSARGALERLQELVQVIEDVLRASPAGWGYGVHTIEVAAPVLDDLVASDDGYTAQAVVSVRAQARLQGG